MTTPTRSAALAALRAEYDPRIAAARQRVAVP